MKRIVATVALMMVVISAIESATAHPREYVNWNVAAPGVAFVTSCPPDEIDIALGERQLGGVIFCAGELVANGLGQASLTINDDINNPSQGTYCQDLNDDTWCGGNPAILPPAPYGIDPITGHRGEPSFAFCGSASLQSPLSLFYKLPVEWADPVNFGGNWDPAVDALVFLKGYAQTNAVYAPCGLDATATPTHGFIEHGGASAPAPTASFQVSEKGGAWTDVGVGVVSALDENKVRVVVRNLPAGDTVDSIQLFEEDWAGDPDDDAGSMPVDPALQGSTESKVPTQQDDPGKHSEWYAKVTIKRADGTTYELTTPVFNSWDEDINEDERVNREAAQNAEVKGDVKGPNGRVEFKADAQAGVQSKTVVHQPGEAKKDPVFHNELILLDPVPAEWQASLTTVTWAEEGVDGFVDLAVYAPSVGSFRFQVESTNLLTGYVDVTDPLQAVAS